MNRRSFLCGAIAVAPAVAAPAAAAIDVPVLPPATVITVQGIKPRDLFTPDLIREIAAELLQYQRDGGRVVAE